MSDSLTIAVDEHVGGVRPGGSDDGAAGDQDPRAHEVSSKSSRPLPSRSSPSIPARSAKPSAASSTRRAWEMSNTDGVQSVIALPGIAKIINAGWSEGALKWRVLPRNRQVLVEALNEPV